MFDNDVTDWPNAIQAYASAPEHGSELVWLSNTEDRAREWLLRRAALWDRLAHGLIPGYTTSRSDAFRLACRLDGSRRGCQRLLKAAAQHRNSARWAVALALGLRQGEVLALKWEDIDLDDGFLVVRRSRHRPQWAHGCAEPCGRKAAGYCPQRRRTNPEISTTKSRAGRRAVGLPEQLVDLLRAHREAQDVEREAAGKRWIEGGWVFVDEQGLSPSHRRGWSEWKDLLAEAGVRDGRLHDARHTAATVLLILGVPERAVMGLMGWSTTAMAARYQHMVDAVRTDIAGQVDELIWKSDTERPPR